jgi:glycosyltransferase involved in cell wall biosynthesis
VKIVLLTESLGSGGAERQVCTLSGEFRRRGHHVSVATYAPGEFHLPLLERENVEHRFLGGSGKVSWTLNVRRFLRTQGQDVVLAFLPGPSAYAELAGVPWRSWGLVVSERSAGIRYRLGPKANLHMLADYVVVNSHSARLAIEKRRPRLRTKLITIYNAVRVGVPERALQAPVEPHLIRLIVAARLDRNKNAQGLLSAVHALRITDPSLRLCVDWYGNQNTEPEVLREMQDSITGFGLEGVFRLHPPTGNIHNLMSQADAIVLPSFYEGLPNAVCEGMALGKPILMSAVCDAGNLVKDGVNGFVFNPHSSSSIADAIARFAKLTSDERNHLGRASRARAEVLFDMNTVVEHYLRILEASAARKMLSVEHWPRDVPADDHA